MEKEEEIKELLSEFLNEDLDRMIFSNPRSKDGFLKMTVRPLMLKGALHFQAEEFTDRQAFQKNLNKEEALEYIFAALKDRYRNGELSSCRKTAHILIGKKGTVTVKVKRRPAKMSFESPVLTHNRSKRYILPEGTPVPFLVKLGVMTPEGKVIKAKYDKFRQINRFLEFIEDILPRLDRERVNTILDFGCGKSYLTFAMYYYLKELKGYQVRIIGLDLKKDVIELCNQLSRSFGFTELQFLQGDIADYDGVDRVDMVVTLHACDTATDYALYKAVRWGARVILSVPCCQHELNRQISNGLLEPVLGYGLIKERMAALFTDGIRGQLLEQAGYRTQILEFIDMEHTPKNIMIRAVYQGKKKDGKELGHMMEAIHVQPTLYRLLKEGRFI